MPGGDRQGISNQTFKNFEELLKVDLEAADGLLGTPDSLAYTIGEIERHIHSWGRWFELASVPNLPTHAVDRVGTSVLAPNPIRIDAGNNAWGTWVQILGSSDTPADVGNVYFDLHEVVIPDTERASEYFVQIALGASGAGGLAAGTYEEFVYVGSATPDTGIIKLQSKRAASGTLAWARCICPGQNTGWLDFYFGIHEYEG